MSNLKVLSNTPKLVLSKMLTPFQLFDKKLELFNQKYQMDQLLAIPLCVHELNPIVNLSLDKNTLLSSIKEIHNNVDYKKMGLITGKLSQLVVIQIKKDFFETLTNSHQQDINNILQV